ncbi:hypothetical protein HDU93_000575 [Gonapodya sp. JEL0774]|nr:hypothetical protein HDU93_000575 [Gonapodya sp. JEL0774]
MNLPPRRATQHISNAFSALALASLPPFPTPNHTPTHPPTPTHVIPSRLFSSLPPLSQYNTPSSPSQRRSPLAHISYGRSIYVTNDQPMLALAKLRAVVNESKIREILRRQREFEKPTDMRRRKKKEAKHRYFLAVLRERVRLAHLLKQR